MIVLHSQPHPRISDQFQIILLFGTGLIGTAVYTKINRHSEYSSSFLPFNWNDPNNQKQHISRIRKFIVNLLILTLKKGHVTADIALVWCAGRAGFSASEKDVQDELLCFEAVLNFLATLMADYPQNRYLIHMISSAGGLFENQRLVDCMSTPNPMRSYGKLKYQQENFLLAQDKRIVKFIYRPSSVYGYVGIGQRMGLIPTLVSNGLQNKTTIIYGNSGTLRDYVFNENIGAYISRNLFNTSCNVKPNVYLLASGKPSSIIEIQQFVENTLGKKIYLNFHSTAATDNTRDITFNSSALPADWLPTDISIGIRFVKDMLISGSSLRIPNKNA